MRGIGEISRCGELLFGVSDRGGHASTESNDTLHTSGRNTALDLKRRTIDRHRRAIDDHSPATAGEIGTILGVLGIEHGENILPCIFLRGTVERRENEHCNLGTHTDTEEGAATRKVENLEESTPDHDRRTD